MNIADIPAEAADRIIERGWTQGDWSGPNGEECLHQAVRSCSPQTGDGYIVSAYLEATGYPTGWNDADGRDRDGVLTLLKGLDVTDAELERVFGSKWESFVNLVRQARNLTGEQAGKLVAAGVAARAAAWAAARDAASAAAWDAARDAAWDAAWAAAGVAARAAARDAAGDAAWAAAGGYVTYDLIGTAGYTRAHYDTLVGPWESVMGPPR